MYLALIDNSALHRWSSEVSTADSAKNSVTCVENTFFLLLLRNLFIHLGDTQDILIAFDVCVLLIKILLYETASSAQ